jgi:hypothetical protein
VTRTKPPVWFWAVAGVLALWGAQGCYVCIQQFRLGHDAMGPATEYQRQLYAALPGWYDYLFALAVGASLVGGLMLLARSRLAVPTFAVSLIAAVLQFGYLFATTDIIARMGFAAAAGFPIVIWLIGLFAVWFARRSERRGWIG